MTAVLSSRYALERHREHIEVTKFENRNRHAFIPDSNMTNPAQIYTAKETHEELHAALDAISNREREYLSYRFGFEDDMEHPLTETSEHFFLSGLVANQALRDLGRKI